jgi:hypothetical protein
MKCPLSNIYYCSVCCSYGHLTKNCSNYEALRHRQVEFVEQLVPPSLLEHYQVSSQTPLTNETLAPLGRPRDLEVEDSDKGIRQILMNNDITPSGKMKVNRRLLKQLADQQGRSLIYLTPE